MNKYRAGNEQNPHYRRPNAASVLAPSLASVGLETGGADVNAAAQKQTQNYKSACLDPTNTCLEKRKLSCSESVLQILRFCTANQIRSEQMKVQMKQVLVA